MEKIVPTWYYQQFDSDYSLDYSGEGYGDWKKANLPINPAILYVKGKDIYF